MRKILILTVLLLLLSFAFALSSDDILARLGPDMDWFSAEHGANATIPDGLSEREAELYRLAYASGHYAALHPQYIEGMYVLNTRTKKFHYSDCMNTLLIDTSNREHSFKTKEELIGMGYDPCGGCKP